MAPSEWSIGGGRDGTNGAGTLVFAQVNYRYECVEQISSKMLSIIALKDVLQSFTTDACPPENVLRRFLELNFARLQEAQMPNGGFSWWFDKSTWFGLSSKRVMVVQPIPTLTASGGFCRQLMV